MRNHGVSSVMKVPILKDWKRGEVIAIISLLVTIVSGIGGFVISHFLKASQKPPLEVPPAIIQSVSGSSGNSAVGVNMGIIVNSPVIAPTRSVMPVVKPVRAETWRGEYTESLIDGDRTVTLILNCTFQSPAFTGLSYEPGYVGQTSGISGTMSGVSVHFTKTSPAGGKVSFEGTLDDSSKTIKGKWRSDGGRQGTFRLLWSPVPFKIE
jgi:hypothetical protein